VTGKPAGKGGDGSAPRMWLVMVWGQVKSELGMSTGREGKSVDEWVVVAGGSLVSVGQDAYPANCRL
jgi:hypothetical protein